mmetsp:Transcript_21051/g.63348  ORF Transcript_21051/g.63348 Transcript_21051/m.63348 type:complete len:202 (+) Transcript_21051:354-959(+)
MPSRNKTESDAHHTHQPTSINPGVIREHLWRGRQPAMVCRGGCSELPSHRRPIAGARAVQAARTSSAEKVAARRDVLRMRGLSARCGSGGCCGNGSSCRAALIAYCWPRGRGGRGRIACGHRIVHLRQRLRCAGVLRSTHHVGVAEDRNSSGAAGPGGGGGVAGHGGGNAAGWHGGHRCHRGAVTAWVGPDRGSSQHGSQL